MSVEFSLPTLACAIEILLFLLICEVQELWVDCDRVRSLILNLLAACGQFRNFNGPFPNGPFPGHDRS